MVNAVSHVENGARGVGAGPVGSAGAGWGGGASRKLVPKR